MQQMKDCVSIGGCCSILMIMVWPGEVCWLHLRLHLQSQLGSQTKELTGKQ